MQIRIDGGGWQSVAMSNSRTNTYGYSERHTIEARAQDAAGQWSPIASDAATTVAEPQPRAWTTKGSETGGCSVNNLGNRCHKYVLNTQNFNAGDYNIECYDRDGYFANNAGFKVHIPANGSIELNCYNGYPGTHWVKIIGGNPTNSEPATW